MKREQNRNSSPKKFNIHVPKKKINKILNRFNRGYNQRNISEFKDVAIKIIHRNKLKYRHLKRPAHSLIYM